MLKIKHIRALQRAIDEAATWRGTLIGNPDTTDLEEFDQFIATAREGLRIVKRDAQTNNSRKQKAERPT